MAKHKGKKVPMPKKHRGVEIEIEIEKKKKSPIAKKIKAKAKEKKIERVMHEFKEGDLHSGSKKGPKVKKRDQAIAIAMNEARKYSSNSDMKKQK